MTSDCYSFINTTSGNLQHLNIEGSWPSFILSDKDDYIPNYIRRTGGWELHLIEDAKKYIKDDTMVLDIGANIGVWSVYMAKNKSLTVHAFEPYLPTYYNLCSNLLINNALNVQTHRCALGSSEEHGKVLPLYVLPSNIGATRLTPIGNQPFKEAPFHATLDYLDRMFPTEIVSFIKIDVEGHEEQVLRGGHELISRSKPVIYFESWDGHPTIQKPLFEYIHSLGYNIQHICSDDYRAIHIDSEFLPSEVINARSE